MDKSLTEIVNYHKFCSPDQTEYFSNQWQHHLASQTQGLLTDLQMVVREGVGWSKVGLHRAVILPHLSWLEKEVHGDNPVILLPDFSLEVLVCVTSLLYSGAVITSPSIKVEDVRELMDALGVNISRSCMVVNKCVIPGQGQVDTEDSHHDNREDSEENNNNNVIGVEQFQDPFEFTSQDSPTNAKFKRKMIARNNKTGKKLKGTNRSESIQAMDYDDVIFDDKLVPFDEGTVAKTDKDIKDMMEDAAELLEECTEDYLTQPSSSLQMSEGGSISNMCHSDQNTTFRIKKLSGQSYENEELIPVAGTSEFSLVEQMKIEDARKVMLKNIQYMLKETIKPDNDDEDLQIVSIDAVELELEESVHSNGEPVIDTVVVQSNDNENLEVDTDRSYNACRLNIVSDQMISCQIRDILSQTDKSPSSNIENVDEDMKIKSPRKRIVDAGSDTAVQGEAAVMSRLRKDNRGVCPLCNKEYSTKMLSGHAARCKGVI